MTTSGVQGHPVATTHPDDVRRGQESTGRQSRDRRRAWLACAASTLHELSGGTMRRMLTACAVVLGLLIPGGRCSARRAATSPRSSRPATARSQHVAIGYKRVCPVVQGGRAGRARHPPRGLGDGEVHADARYKILDQNRKFDFYLVDVIGEPRQAHRRPGLGLDGRHRAQRRPHQGGEQRLHARQGRGEHQRRARRFPINLGVGFYGVSAGTTAGHVSFCHHGSKIESSRATHGRLYHATGLSGICRRLDAAALRAGARRATPERSASRCAPTPTRSSARPCPTAPTASSGTACTAGTGHDRHHEPEVASPAAAVARPHG